MSWWLRIPLGVACLGAGGALLAWNGAAIALTLMHSGGGLALTNLGGLLLGLTGLGACADYFGWLRSRGAGQKETIANSIWADRAAIEGAGIDQKTPRSAPDAETGKEGIYLGFFEDALGTFTLRYKGGKHLLSFGTPGANKSAGLVVPNLAHLPRSVIVIDPKGELAAITARKRATMGRVIVLNPFALLADDLPHLESEGWNPLLQLDPEGDDFESDARCIADALIDKSGDGGHSKFFETSAENLAAALVMWERYISGDKSSLRNVRAQVSEPNEYDDNKRLTGGFLFTLQRMAKCEHDAIRNAGARLYARLTDPSSLATSAQDVIDTLMASTRFLDHPCIRADMFGKNAIDFGELHREITTIYLILPAHELTSQAKWLRLFANLALRELYKHRPSKPMLPPVLFLLDEFGNLGWLSEIETALNLSRGYRIQLWMFLQNLAQLKANYKTKWESFFSGAGAVTSFKTGDMETAEQLAKIYGNTEKSIPTQTATGVSNTPHAIPLIRPEDINRLARGKTISIIEPCNMPVEGSAPVYPETDYGRGLDPNPYFHG
jgi:type IV secretion system protein VirD4